MVAFEQKKDLPLVYFMGVTGSGKSTIINYLLGGDMHFEKKGF